MMDFWKSLGGMVTAELTSADLNRRLTDIIGAGIGLDEIHYRDEMTARFRVSRRKIRCLRQFAGRKGDAFRVVNRGGIYWKLRSLSRRKLLMAGLAAQLALMLWVPSRVLILEVEGNHRIPARLILEAAGESGIGFGASRRAVRSEKMKNDLLARVPELQWAGVNTYGCRAVITVREREQPPEAAEADRVQSITAARDGVILSVTVTRGSGLCTPGQAVQAGETLISGYTDHGLTITATRAEGEVMALTSREFQAVTPEKYLRRRAEGKKRNRYSLIIGKKRINFYKGSGILDTTCVKMYSEYVLTLPGGFALPVKLVRQVTMEWETEEALRSEADAQGALVPFVDAYLRQQMIAGTIGDREEQITMDGGVYRLSGRYACREMIGRYTEEEIGEIYGETNRTDGER